MEGVDLHGWFEKAELESCPTCEQHAVLTLSTGSLFCMECGELRPPDAAPPETCTSDKGATARPDNRRGGGSLIRFTDARVRTGGDRRQPGGRRLRSPRGRLRSAEGRA